MNGRNRSSVLTPLEKQKDQGHETPGPADDRKDTVDDVHGIENGVNAGSCGSARGGNAGSAAGAEGGAAGQHFPAQLVAADDAKAVRDGDVDRRALPAEGGGDAQREFAADAGAGSAAILLVDASR